MIYMHAWCVHICAEKEGSVCGVSEVLSVWYSGWDVRWVGRDIH